jgi:hypothetical protein
LIQPEWSLDLTTPLFSAAHNENAAPICLRFAAHFDCCPLALKEPIIGKATAAKIATIAMTVNNSTKVNPRC